MISLFREYAAMQKLLSRSYDVIFYAENAYYYQYMEHLFEEVLAMGASVAYISSAADDAVLQRQHPKLETYYLKATAAAAFPRLRARAVIMTMPDLQQFIFKKSPTVGKYIYLFHALVSTHQQYRQGAFDHYDAIFCTGPHHEKEIREREALAGLRPKDLVPYGYPLLCKLKAAGEKIKGEPLLLIAPSWYEGGILDSCISHLIEVVREEPVKVMIRAHPEFIKRKKKQYRQLEKAVVPGKVEFDTEPSLAKSMLRASHLVTDRSGIAFEAAFTRDTPVIFIDTPPKIQNPDWGAIRIVPAENRFREHVGIIIPPSNLEQLKNVLAAWPQHIEAHKKTIAAAREAMVYKSSDAGARYISALLSQ